MLSGKQKQVLIIAVLISICNTAVANAADWAQWKQQQTVTVQETAGIDRSNEPVEFEIQYRQPVRNGNAAAIDDDIRRELRVLRLDGNGSMTEIPSQAFGIRHAAPGRTASSAENAPKEMFVRVNVAFFSDVNAYSTAKYRILLDNAAAKKPAYKTGLSAEGSGVGFTVDNDYFRIITEEKSGQIDQIDLKFATKPSFRFKYGTLHWNPDFIVVPEDFPVTGYTWWYAHHFDKPETETESGPVFFSVRRKQLIPGQDTAYMDIYYRFYAGQPYFIMESYIEAKKDTRTFAIRNDELAFGRTDFTHAGWRNRTPDMMEGHDGEIGSTGLYHDTRIAGHVLGSSLPPNLAWISLVHPENGYAVGSIRLDWKNVNAISGEPSPIYNSHTVISEHDEGLYWFRSLIYSPRTSAGVSSDTVRGFLVDVPKGSSYYEKNAYLLYGFDLETQFEPIDGLWKKLRTPLSVHVAAE